MFETDPLSNAITSIQNGEAQPKAASANGANKPKNGHKKIMPTSNDSERFPIEVFGPTISAFITRWQQYLHYDPAFAGTALLAATSAAIGESTRLLIKEGWEENSTLWLCGVQRSGFGKSHVSTKVFGALDAQNEKYRRSYADQVATLKNWQAQPKNERGEEPPAPAQLFIKISDGTVEAIGVALNNNPRGLIFAPDEFKAWLANFARYNAGSDTEFWLSAWSRQPINVLRLSRQSVSVKSPFVTVAGSTQPEVLIDMFGSLLDNGLTPRVLFYWPKEKPPTRQGKVPDGLDLFGAHLRIQNFLLDSNPDKPNILPLSDDAYETFAEWQFRLKQRVYAEEDSRKRSVLSKFDIHAARFSLILAMLDGAVKNALPRTVEVDHIRRAITLAGYFEAQATKVHKHLYERSPVDDLDKTKRAFYEALPDIVTTQNAVALGTQKYNIPERTVKRFLSDKKLFTKVAYGHYGKLL